MKNDGSENDAFTLPLLKAHAYYVRRPATDAPNRGLSVRPLREDSVLAVESKRADANRLIRTKELITRRREKGIPIKVVI